MQIYTFDYETRAYSGAWQLSPSDCDPRSNDGVILIPGNATVEEPPRCSDGLWPFWKDGRWEVYELVAEIPDNMLALWRKRIEIITGQQP